MSTKISDKEKIQNLGDSCHLLMDRVNTIEKQASCDHSVYRVILSEDGTIYSIFCSSCDGELKGEFHLRARWLARKIKKENNL